MLLYSGLLLIQCVCVRAIHSRCVYLCAFFVSVTRFHWQQFPVFIRSISTNLKYQPHQSHNFIDFFHVVPNFVDWRFAMRHLISASNNVWMCQWNRKWWAQHTNRWFVYDKMHLTRWVIIIRYLDIKYIIISVLMIIFYIPRIRLLIHSEWRANANLVLSAKYLSQEMRKSAQKCALR